MHPTTSQSHVSCKNRNFSQLSTKRSSFFINRHYFIFSVLCFIHPMLQTAPSLDVYTSTTDEATEAEGDGGGDLQRSVTIGDRIDALVNFDFGESGDMGLIQEENEDEDESEHEAVVEFSIVGDFDVADGDGVALASSLRSQAELLLSNGDLQGAEDYFYRSTKANPRDGEVLSQYAKLLWQLHQDRDTAVNYFERAVLAAPDNSDVLGAYASFLWETVGDEDEDEDENKLNEERMCSSAKLIHSGTNIEDYYKKMVNENSSDPLFLKTYSQFLHQVKQDLRGAEEFYTRAIQANPEDSEIMSQYARLIWELHRDRAKAISSFERAIAFAPGDCHIAAAYAGFLWEIGEDEDGEDHVTQA